jgi:uncharacterized protein (DUF488 family)
MVVYTIGHGTRPLDELMAMLAGAGVRTLVDVRRYPGSRRNPQFNQGPLQDALTAAGIAYRHAVDLGGRLSDEPGEERFGCIRVPAFRAYAARMGTPGWQEALAAALAEPSPALMCSETPWTKCHRRLIAELLHARGDDVRHLVSPGRTEPHVPWSVAETRENRLYLCGEPVA